jgi:hypothetical protein
VRFGATAFLFVLVPSWMMRLIRQALFCGDELMKHFYGTAAIAVTLAMGITCRLTATAGTEDPQTKEEPQTYSIPEVVLKQTKPIFDGKTLDGWIQIPADSWKVTDGAMASTGAGRGVIYTKDDYAKYRLFFTMRHVSGKPDHQACVLIFCTRPEEGKKALDALGAIQFQVPNGGHWDYRPGQNKSGQGFTSSKHPKFKAAEWSQVEMLVDAATGTARMAVAQPVGSKAVPVLNFNVPEAGKVGPIAWQMHNKGLFDEYKDVRIEVNPAVDEFITTK